MSNIDNQIAKLDKKIAEAKRTGQFIQALRLSQEREKLVDLKIVSTRVTLKEAFDKQSREQRMEMTTQVIIAVAISDILVSATMDIEQKFRQFGISGIPMMKEIRGITKQLANVVHTIDAPGVNILSETYIDVADRVEEKVMDTLKEYIYDEMHKVLQSLNDGEAKE